ncbi:MAG: hypothetical protein OEY34_03025 [Cyclobacteriaceae bacterium]|nr:hypothetical protein [Cyclobacteriaceae bacterium]
MAALTFDTFDEFALYIYIYIANADGFIHIKEKESILAKLKKQYPTESDYEGLKRFKHMNKVYEDNIEDQDQTIKLNVEKFPNIRFTDKNKIFSDVYDIINSDGIVDDRETEALNKLKKIIEKVF